MTLRYAIAFEGETIPTWAQRSIEALRVLDGRIDVTWIKVSRQDSFFVAQSLTRGRLMKNHLQPFEVVGGRPDDKKSVMDKIRSLKLDFIFSLGIGEFTTEWTDITKEGIWNFRFGLAEDSGDDFGRAEFAAGENVLNVLLERTLIPGQPRKTLRHGRFKTSLSSHFVNRNSVLCQCSDWPAQFAREILQNGHLRLQTLNGPSFYNQSQTGLFGRTFYRIIEFGRRVRRLFTYQQWNIGVVRGSIESLLQADLQISWLPAPRWPYCYADPFPVEYKGQRYIVAEQYDFEADRGSIVAFQIDEAGRPTLPPITAMNFPFHVSYPCLVKDGSALYCVAETLESREISIYQCERFPNLWTKVVDVAVDCRFADPTLFFDRDRWWILSTLFDENSGGNSSLYAFYADEIQGPWIPHLKNPIKCDVVSSRSAGNPFRIGRRLFRPSQDCSEQYGSRVIINEIKILSPTDFHERQVRAIAPHPEYPDGFHHVATFGDMILVDGRRDIFYPRAAIVKLRRYIKRIIKKRQFRQRSEHISETLPTSTDQVLRIKREEFF